MAKADKKANQDSCRVLTPEFRVSYPHVFKTQGMKGAATKKYSITMLFPKNADLTAIKNVIKAAKIAKYGEDPKAWPKGLESPVSDGDAPKNADKEGYAGHWVLKASASEDRKPTVVDQKVEPIIDQSAFYPGCYARASIFAYVWDNEFGQGISFTLDHVQKTRDGKSFGGRPAADQVFTPVSMDETDLSEETSEDSFM